jgi:hypothetical protein
LFFYFQLYKDMLASQYGKREKVDCEKTSGAAVCAHLSHPFAMHDGSLYLFKSFPHPNRIEQETRRIDSLTPFGRASEFKRVRNYV